MNDEIQLIPGLEKALAHERQRREELEQALGRYVADEIAAGRFVEFPGTSVSDHLPDRGDEPMTIEVVPASALAKERDRRKRAEARIRELEGVLRDA